MECSRFGAEIWGFETIVKFLCEGGWMAGIAYFVLRRVEVDLAERARGANELDFREIPQSGIKRPPSE